jgi:hypothetical protein
MVGGKEGDKRLFSTSINDFAAIFNKPSQIADNLYDG